MDYPLENLGPERFQHACQALLIASETNIKCFPVGMPDGGRDATQRLFEEDEKSFLIYQIKFSREKISGKTATAWILSNLDGEVEKAQKLKLRGAKRYTLITNASGTSHLDTGSIDKLHTELESLFGMPVDCWFRDDINRMLDGNWDIKLRYPELLTGQDFLRLLLEQKEGEAQNRRTNALRAFLADQYKEDQEVKFKQVELQNKLLDLFVDLPFSVAIENGMSFINSRAPARIDPCIEITEHNKSIILRTSTGDAEIGTASLLLNERAGNLLDHVVVEGAPGQGKSTLAQYLCQVHRIRLLNKSSELQELVEEHRTAPVHIPFKVDLRDLAEWLSGYDPFSPQGAKEPIERTVEAFLARLVAHKAGGINFDVHDLVEISKISPLFIAFDGLDEVADIKRRSDVVGGITKALARLKENCQNLKAIVTSRPAAFANSPGFDPSTFPYLQLGAVTRTQINSYASKWLNARSLANNERKEFEQILEEKLDQPHLRDLSKNPMQLTILLSLILTKGAALPDKRTSLYDAYIDLFFGRESSKNVVVRQNLDLLKDIHRYLAWVLHSRAEGRGAGTDGRITTEEMKSILHSYLSKEGQRTEIIEEIFNAMLERIVMIVSRIEGTHEFEVQPLREYFAARYLYDTAPYSPTGEEKSGTKPDRFDAIARNPFWLNVARFFCGCFSKGELLDLADRVKNLQSDSEIGETRQPTLFAAMLLQDWVFSQSPKAISEVTAPLMHRSSIRKLLASDIGHRVYDDVRIPLSCGGREIAEKAFTYLINDTLDGNLRGRLSRFIRANLPTEEIDRLWIKAKTDNPESRIHWLHAGLFLDSLDRSTSEEIREIVGTASLTRAEIDMFWRSGQATSLIDTSRANSIKCIEFATDLVPYWPSHITSSPFYLLPILQSFALFNDAHASEAELYGTFVDACHEFSTTSRPSISDEMPELKAFEEKCYSVSDEVCKAITTNSSEGKSSSIWSLIVAACIRAFGDTPLVTAMCFTLCNLESRRGRQKKAALFSPSEPLIDRLRFAKSTAKNVDDWIKNAYMAANDIERSLALRVLFNWSPATTIASKSEEISEILDSLSETAWQQLVPSLSTAFFMRGRSNRKPSRDIPFTTTSLRFAYLFSQLEGQRYSRAIFLRYFIKGSGLNIHLHTEYFRSFHAIRAAQEGQIEWKVAIEIVKSVRKGAYQSYGRATSMPITIANQVLKNPDGYPIALWDQAQDIILSQTSRITAVATTAKKEKWFSD